MEILLIQQEILKISNIFNNISLFLDNFFLQLYVFYFNIFLSLNLFLKNIFETVIGLQYPNGQPCWAKPNTLVELFNDPKMLIFTNDINSLNFKFDIYIPKPFEESISIPENSIFAKPKEKTTIYLSEIQNIELSDEEIDKLTNSIKFIEVQINIEKINLIFASDNINNKPPFFGFILNILNIFYISYNNNLFQQETIFIKNLSNFFSSQFFNLEITFLFFLFKNEFFISKILFINNLQYKNLNSFFNIISFNNKYFFLKNIQNKFFQMSKKEFPIKIKNIIYNELLFNIFYFKFNILNYKFLKLSIFNFKISNKIIQNNLFKINSDYLLKSLKYKKIPFFKFQYKKENLSFYLGKKLNIYFNKKLLKHNIKKLNWSLNWYYKTLLLYKKLLEKNKYLKKSEFLLLYKLRKKYLHKIVEKNINLQKYIKSLFRYSVLPLLSYFKVFKQFFLNFKKICIKFKIKKIKKNKRIFLTIKSLNLFKNITFYNNYKIKYFNNLIKNIKTNFFKKIILLFFFIFFLSIFLLINIGFILYIWFKKLISKKLQKIIKKKYYRKIFFIYWYTKTRSYRISCFFTLYFKKIINLFNYILNYFNFKIYQFIILLKIIKIILLKIIKFFLLKIIIFVYLYKFLFLLYYNFFKNNYFNIKINLIFNNYLYIPKFCINFQKIFYFIRINSFFIYLNYIAKINVKIILYFNKEDYFINYFFKNINLKIFFNKYLNLYLTLCFYYILKKKKNIYFDYFFFKENDFFNLIFFNFYISTIFNSNMKIFLINFFLKSIFNKKKYLKKYFLKLKVIKIINILKKIKNNKYLKKKNLIFLIYFILRIYLFYLSKIIIKKIKIKVNKKYIIKKKNVKNMNKGCILNTANKSNVLRVKLFHIYRSGCNSKSKISFFSKTSVRELKPLKKIEFKKKKKIFSLFVRTKQWILRSDGSQRKFSDNSIIILKKNSTIWNKYIVGPTTLELKRKKYISFFKHVF